MLIKCMDGWAAGAAHCLEARIRIQADPDELEKQCREKKEGQGCTPGMKQSTEHTQDGE